MNIGQELEALIPLIFPAGIIGGHSLFRQEVVYGGTGEGVSGSAGSRRVVGETSRIFLHPLHQLIHGGGRVGNCLGIISQNYCGSSVGLYIVSGKAALGAYSLRIGDLGIIQLHKCFLSYSGNQGGQVIASHIHQVVIGVGLICLVSGCQHIGHGLGSGTAQHELQLGGILIRIIRVAVEILDQRLIYLTHVVRSGGPDGYCGLISGVSGLAGSRCLSGISVSGTAAACHTCSQNSCHHQCQ